MKCSERHPHDEDFCGATGGALFDALENAGGSLLGFLPTGSSYDSGRLMRMSSPARELSDWIDVDLVGQCNEVQVERAHDDAGVFLKFAVQSDEVSRWRRVEPASRLLVITNLPVDFLSMGTHVGPGIR